MNEIFVMDGNGPYVWVAYGITLVALIWNVWSARRRLRQKLAEARQFSVAEEPARRPKVSQL